MSSGNSPIKPVVTGPAKPPLRRFPMVFKIIQTVIGSIEFLLALGLIGVILEKLIEELLDSEDAPAFAGVYMAFSLISGFFGIVSPWIMTRYTVVPWAVAHFCSWAVHLLIMALCFTTGPSRDGIEIIGIFTIVLVAIRLIYAIISAIATLFNSFTNNCCRPCCRDETQ